jgi:hypothetical protein
LSRAIAEITADRTDDTFLLGAATRRNGAWHNTVLEPTRTVHSYGEIEQLIFPEPWLTFRSMPGGAIAHTASGPHTSPAMRAAYGRCVRTPPPITPG